jgi:hypothetical protein
MLKVAGNKTRKVDKLEKIEEKGDLSG